MAVKLFQDRIENDDRQVPWIVKVYEAGDGEVDIVAEDSNGNSWTLLTLNSDGTFTRSESIEPESGFKVNKSGQLVESK
jgi:hypothetical protein